MFDWLRRLIQFFRKRKYVDDDITFAMFPNGCKAVKPLHNPPEEPSGRPGRNLGFFHSGFGIKSAAIYYYIKNDTGDIEGKKLEVALISREIGKWEARIGIPIYRLKSDHRIGNLFINGPNGFGPQINIEFVSGDKMTNKGALAEAGRSNMKINDNWGWGVDAEDVARNLGFTVCHEFGHNLKYLHSTQAKNPGGVMNPRYQDKRAVLTEYELHDAIEIDYGANPKWKSSVFRKNHENYWKINWNTWWANFKKRNRGTVDPLYFKK